jgi:hypothetical protein
VNRLTISRKPVSCKVLLKKVDNENISKPVLEVLASDKDIAACDLINIIDISTLTVTKPRVITSKQKNTSIHVVPDSGREDDSV